MIRGRFESLNHAQSDTIKPQLAAKPLTLQIYFRFRRAMDMAGLAIAWRRTRVTHGGLTGTIVCLARITPSVPGGIANCCTAAKYEPVEVDWRSGLGNIMLLG